MESKFDEEPDPTGMKTSRKIRAGATLSSSLVYCDDRLAVINKSAGVSLITRRGEPFAAADRLVASLPAQTRVSFGLEGGSLWLVHRLDVATTGLVLLARDQETHRELSVLFSRKLIFKTYLALVWGHPHPSSGRYEWALAPDRHDRRRMKADPLGRPAVTDYQTLATGPHVTLLALRPKTGRTHQLRVHLAHAGHWIVGDDLYGGARHRGVKDWHLRSLLDPLHLLLHAWRLSFPGSPAGFPRELEAPLPADFAAVLGALDIAQALDSARGDK